MTMMTGLIMLIIGKSTFSHICNNYSHSHLLSTVSPERANSNDEIRATNTQDNSENRSNANSGDDTNLQESESQSRNSSKQSLRRTSPRITREQEKFQALLQE